jgi:hypothetical protein
MSAVETEAPTTPAPEAQAEQDREQRFRWSAWVHYGDGALECDHKIDGRCQDQGHFHAWIRLPNPFQHRDIREKAAAAKARRIRSLKDEESDARVTLELELDRMREMRDILVDEIIDKDFAEDYTNAVREVDETEDATWEPDPDSDEEQVPPKVYAHIDQDREELARQEALPEDQQDADALAELRDSVGAYDKAVMEALSGIQEPRRASLKERPMEELLDIVRKERIEGQGNEVYLHTYNTWQMYVCTLKPATKGTPRERAWPSIEAMKYEEAPEVIEAVGLAFNELETSSVQDRMGKGF